MEERRIQDPDHPCGRRGQCNVFDEELIEKIAEKAAAKAIEQMTSTIYKEIGRGVVNKALYLLGAGAVALWAFLQVKGGMK